MGVESTYVVCEKDEALLAHLQRSMVKDAQEAGGEIQGGDAGEWALCVSESAE